jgi:transcriptional regulator GlxA family with amidase domain
VFASWATWVLFLLVHSPLTDVLNLVVVPLALYGLAFMALIRRDEPQAVLAHVAAEPAPPLAGVASADAETSTRYRRSGLTAERAAAYRERLETVMTLEKPWLENDLTLPTLAERANLPPHHLSQVLNEALGETFFDFINRHRVAEVQRCLADPAYRGQSLLEIALAAGFNSKTAFNSAFRAHTGTTPSTWRRMHAQWNGSAESAGRS